MKIAILTSSRADYSIYYPLLKLLQIDNFFELNIIAFGTHLSDFYGKTINQIKADGFIVTKELQTMPDGDNSYDISKSIGKTVTQFSEFWEKDNSDLIFALGDRFEMFAAVVSALPFGKKIAHIHGGETTLGAIDEVFRNTISQIAKIHFVTTEKYAKRVKEIIGNSNNIFNVGALSLDNLKQLKLLNVEEFTEKFNIDLRIPSILFTFHPETVDYKRNEFYINEILSALSDIKDYQIIITMPNSDTMGNVIRRKLNEFVSKNNSAIIVETFGTIGYLTCMKFCSFMLGNSSSGFVEAAFFPKYVINLGDRQKGRIVTENIYNCEISRLKILDSIMNFHNSRLPNKIETYGNGTAANQIVSTLKNISFEKL